MTDDTIELIAKAIHEATTAHFEGCRPWWNDLCEDDKLLCREQARAALSAMPQHEVTVKDAAKVLPRHIETILFQLLSVSNWCDRAYAGEVEANPREYSRNIVGAFNNVRASLEPQHLSAWDETMKRIQDNFRADRGVDHPIAAKLNQVKDEAAKILLAVSQQATEVNRAFIIAASTRPAGAPQAIYEVELILEKAVKALRAISEGE